MKPRILSLLAASSIMLGACGSGSDGASGSPVATAGEPTSTPGADTSLVTTDAATPARSEDEPRAATTVVIERSRFDPIELRVAPGTTVTFVNDDPYAHTVTSRDEAPMQFDSGDLAEGDTFEVTFDEPGEYPYFCRIHPTMRAIVVVE